MGVPLTFLGGALMHESKKPAWLDVLFGLAALGVWGASLEWTQSYVFWAMTLGLLVVMANAAYLRQRSRSNQP